MPPHILQCLSEHGRTSDLAVSLLLIPNDFHFHSTSVTSSTGHIPHLLVFSCLILSLKPSPPQPFKFSNLLTSLYQHFKMGEVMLQWAICQFYFVTQIMWIIQIKLSVLTPVQYFTIGKQHLRHLTIPCGRTFYFQFLIMGAFLFLCLLLLIMLQ